MTDYLSKYAFSISSDAIGNLINNIASNIDGMTSPKVLKDCFSFMDLTSLHSNDTEASIRKMVEKVNDLQAKYPEYPLPASVCVYPNFAPVLKVARNSEELHVTTVASCFPSAQSYLEVKVRECELAVENGADEVDIVLALNAFLSGDSETASAEITAMRQAVDKVAHSQGREVVLKVILETGLLVSPENIANASFLAMEAGADFIKTSTGKVPVNATPVAACVMCGCIKKFYETTGKKVGFKAAGGISSAADAVSYYSIVSTILGKEWLTKQLFRLGVSRLANNLMSALEQKTVSFF